MEYMTIQKNVGHSPRKLRLVADMIRKMSPEQALLTLQFTPRAAALDLAKAIKTAMANSQDKTGLDFKKIEINEGVKMRRNRIGTAGRGRSRPYKKRFSHIHIVLTDEPPKLSALSSQQSAKTGKRSIQKAAIQIEKDLEQTEEKLGEEQKKTTDHRPQTTDKARKGEGKNNGTKD